MSKPIRFTTALIQQMMMDFGQKLSGTKFFDGKVSYTKTYTYEDGEESKAVILFEPVAYAKMLMLLHTFDSEVGWHGTVERVDDRTFVIKDILVYPQEVTGTTVNPDQEKYQTWMMELDDDTFNALHMQGHSHVNMATTPSSVDTTFYESILNQLGDDDFYIFMIFNKRLERTIKIYDMKSNTLYENGDVSIGIRCDGGDMEQFVADAKDDVVRKVYTTPSAYQVSTTSAAKTADKGAKKNEAKKPANSPSDFSRYPGYYGDYGGSYGAGYGDAEPDYDAMIFGKREQAGKRKDNWWSK